VAVEEEVLEALGKDILLFLTATVVITPLAKVVKLSPVLLFLLFGCALGPHGLNFFSDTEVDAELGEFGILFLLFVEGLNLSPERIKALGSFLKLGANQLLFSIAVIFFGIFIGGPYILPTVGSLLNLDDSLISQIESPVVAFAIASAGALSSSAFVLPILKEKGWDSKPDGIAALSILLLQDIAVAPLLVIIPLIAEIQANGGSMAQDPATLGIAAAKATFGFGATLWLGSILLRRVFEVVAKTGSAQTFVAASLLVSVGLGVIADKLGISATTGAFAAGVLLAESGYRAQIEADIRPFEGILLGIFFITAGASLDPALVIQEWPVILAGITTFLAIKIGILLAAGEVALGLTRAEAIRVALLLSTGGEFAFVIFKLASDVGVLPDELGQILTACVIISMALTPLLGDVAEKIGETLEGTKLDQSITCEVEEAPARKTYLVYDPEVDAYVVKVAEASESEVPDASAIAIEAEEDEGEGLVTADAYVVCGYGAIGQGVCTVLRKNSKMSDKPNYVAFDNNPKRTYQGAANGDTVQYGDGASKTLLEVTGVEKPRAIIITHTDDDLCIESTSRLRDSFPDTPIYVRAPTTTAADVLKGVGATQVIVDAEATADALSKFVSLQGTIKGTGGLLDAVAGMVTPTNSNRIVWSGIEIDDATMDSLADETCLDSEQIRALLDLYETSPERNEAGERQLAELRNEVMRTNQYALNDQELADWMGYDDALNKWVKGEAETTWVTFPEFVRFTAKIGAEKLQLRKGLASK